MHDVTLSIYVCFTKKRLALQDTPREVSRTFILIPPEILSAKWIKYMKIATFCPATKNIKKNPLKTGKVGQVPEIEKVACN